MTDGGASGPDPDGERPRVVLTRAAEHNAALARRLDKVGLDSLSVPMIEVRPPQDGGNALEAAVAGLDLYHWLIVTSANGVRAVTRMLEQVDRPWPDHLRVGAVGPATAAEAEANGWPVHFTPQRATALDLAAEFDPAPDDGPPIRVLAALAELGGATVKKGLSEKGYRVDHVIAYRTVSPDPLDDPDDEAAFTRTITDAAAVTFTSPSTVTRFVNRFGADVVPPVAVCIGPRTAKRAERLGVPVTAVADPHTEDGLIATLATLLVPERLGR
ncbi:MAG: uroporphyrinogen-III synthase [Acidimicrobiia bacterium]|nr:uroporphyrinogen-III synthase [Acidimicrobiia bacterium]